MPEIKPEPHLDPIYAERLARATTIAPKLCNLITFIDATEDFNPKETATYIEAILDLILATEDYHNHIDFAPSGSIASAFCWSRTKEGTIFWGNFCSKLPQGAHDNV